jgi:TonB family protein
MKQEGNLSKMKRTTLACLFLSAVTFLAVSTSWATPACQGVAADESTGRDTVFVEADELPVFPEGDMAILKFIAANTKYPEDAKRKGITGKVIVKFIVEKDCSVSDVTVLLSVDPQLDAEAIRVVKLLPKFEKSAKINGKPVAVWYMVPITFSLK